MVFFNYSTMQMAAKVVYYGPGLCGKTTNLQWIFDHTSTDSRGEMVSLATETDRTLFFDLLPIDVGTIAGFNTRIQLYTVPGQVFYNTTRKLVLKGVDGVVFVADSQAPMLQANIDSFANLEENLGEMGLNLETIPVVLQYNKRDLPNVLSVEELNKVLNRGDWPCAEASAIQGEGVFETLKLVSKATLLALKKRLTKGRSESAAPRTGAAPVRPALPKSPLKPPLPPKSAAPRPPVATPPERSSPKTPLPRAPVGPSGRPGPLPRVPPPKAAPATGEAAKGQAEAGPETAGQVPPSQVPPRAVAPGPESSATPPGPLGPETGAESAPEAPELELELLPDSAEAPAPEAVPEPMFEPLPEPELEVELEPEPVGLTEAAAEPAEAPMEEAPPSPDAGIAAPKLPNPTEELQPLELEPAVPELVVPEPEPAEPALSAPEPAVPALSAPAPSAPAPSAPALSAPALSAPAPSALAPSVPAPSALELDAELEVTLEPEAELEPVAAPGPGAMPPAEQMRAAEPALHAAPVSAPKPSLATPLREPAAEPVRRRSKSRLGGIDALAELEKLRRQALHPRAGRPARNGQEIRREVEFDLSKSVLQRASRFSLTLRLEDQNQQVLDEARQVHVDIEDPSSLEKLLLRFNIALNTKET